MSVRVMADVWDFGPDDPVDLSVLLALANHCNDQGKNCFPTIARVAKMIRRSESTVTRSISSLESGDWLTVERGDGRGNSSQYTINIRRLKGLQRASLLEEERVAATKERVAATTKKGSSDDGAIRKNHQEPSVKQPSGGEAPPSDANTFQCAKWFWEELCQAYDPQTFTLTADSIQAYGRELQRPPNLVVVELLAKAKAAREHGATINRFWFQDAKYRNSNGSNGNGTPKKSRYRDAKDVLKEMGMA